MQIDNMLTLGSGQLTGYLSGEDAGFINVDIFGAIISNNSVFSNILLFLCRSPMFTPEGVRI